MPTDRPRYQVTDTGPVRTMLDDASLVWPDIKDRKALLLRLAETGAAQLAAERHAQDLASQRARQLAAVNRSRALIDADVLLGDTAWE